MPIAAASRPNSAISKRLQVNGSSAMGNGRLPSGPCQCESRSDWNDGSRSPVPYRIDRPGYLRLEHFAYGLVRARIRRVIDVGVADVAREKRAAFRRDAIRDLKCAAIDRLEILLAPDDTQLLAMGIIGERLHHVRAG